MKMLIGSDHVFLNVIKNLRIMFCISLSATPDNLVVSCLVSKYNLFAHKLLSSSFKHY